MKPCPILCALLLTGALQAQEATNTAPEIDLETAEPGWSFSASVYTYILPEDDDYAQPTITADHGWLHLEARYNYEDLETGSVWMGYNFSLGSRLTLDFTPMIGRVFGNTAGVAPGYHLTLGWWRLELYSEGEYVFETSDRTGSFFYSWSELTLSPLDWLRAGWWFRGPGHTRANWRFNVDFWSDWTSSTSASPSTSLIQTRVSPPTSFRSRWNSKS